MNPLVRRVQRLQRLAVFEAAARLGSFTAAARELGMTQPAVTRQVRALESAVGRTLFDRGPNRVDLNVQGRILLDAIQNGFTAVDRAITGIEPVGGVFVLAANPGVAQRWLVPRLSGLRDALGDVDLRLWLFDRDGELDAASYDAAIHLGSEGTDRPGGRTRELFPEITVPVASAEYAANHGLGPDTEPGRLLEHDLLHLDPQDRSWMDWMSWFAAVGVQDESDAALTARVIYNNYAMVVQDVQAGRGVALGWRHMIDDLLDQGLLVPVGPEIRHPSTRCRLLWTDGPQNEVVNRLGDWLDSVINS